MHIGYLKYAVFNPAFANQDFFLAPGLSRFYDWQQNLLNYYAKHVLFYDTIKYLAICISLILCFFLNPITAGFLSFLTLLFFSSIPANYYYAWLALLPINFFNERQSYSANGRLIALGIFLAYVPIAAILYPDAIILNGYINTTLFLISIFIITSYSYLVGFPLITGPMDEGSRAHYLQKSLLTLTFALVFLAILSLF